MKLFSALHDESRTILLVPHDINVAARADRVLFMKDGFLHREVRLHANEEENLATLQEALHS